ncbi:hypothetical protein E2562_017546 [Oryza meyeriana var. granulata]|uniref:Uncharacterized protein n=1 Tax=Oryza meyeriana var. granulata TaxID=110450 RepID=A0A6G1C6V8_9ORYZ|nr:hypothetical protein E2562_017546 [Oryza meyeriana var. granulata]
MHLAADCTGKNACRIVPSASHHQHRDKRTPPPTGPKEAAAAMATDEPPASLGPTGQRRP